MTSNVWIYVLIVCNCFVKGSFSTQKSMEELELADLELTWTCNDLSTALRSGILHGDFNKKIAADRAYGRLLKLYSKMFKRYVYIPQELERNYTFFVMPGDGLLPEEEWNMLVSYYNDNEELESVVKVPCSNNTEGCLFTKGEYQHILTTSRDVDLLNTTWVSWQHGFGVTSDNYSAILELTKKAAILNDYDEVASYWEYLNEFSGAYSKAREFWQEIKPLYLKLQKFVRNRLNNYYKINETSEIPVFLLGSNFGNDWSYIADIILPHPQVYYDVETFLKYKTLAEIYILADNLTRATSLGTLGQKFWANSSFNMTYCEPHIFSFCDDGYSEVYDCNESSWVSYLDAHETAFRIALRNQDYFSLMRQNLRFSGLDEAIAALGPLLATESIHYHGVKTVANITDESAKMMKLMLAALRFLPQLPYYLAADEWRLQELELPSANVAEYWWKVRNEYQGIKSVSGAERDFLRDEYITSNRPYISKFFGIILAFQFVNYYRSQMADPEGNIAFEFGNDAKFQSMIRKRPTTDWVYLVKLNYGLDLSTSALLEYFHPLEQYLEEAPMEQAPIVTTTSTTTTTISTPPPAVVMEYMKDGKREDSVQGDQPKVNATLSAPNNGSSHITDLAIYTGVFISCLVVVVAACQKMSKENQ